MVSEPIDVEVDSELYEWQKRKRAEVLVLAAIAELMEESFAPIGEDFATYLAQDWLKLQFLGEK